MAFKVISDSFTRPADTTAYAATDLVANSTTAGSVVPLKFNLGAGGGLLHGVVFSKSDTTATNSDFTLHLYGASPTCANGDNGLLSTDVASKIGEIDLQAVMEAFTDDAAKTLRVGETGFVEPIALPYNVVYVLVEANAAYTPASAEVFTLKLHVEV